MLKVSFHCFHCLQISPLVLLSPANLLCPAGNITDPPVSCKYMLGSNLSGWWQKNGLSWGKMVPSPYWYLVAAWTLYQSVIFWSLLQSATNNLLLIFMKYTKNSHFPYCGMASTPAVTNCQKTRIKQGSWQAHDTCCFFFFFSLVKPEGNTTLRKPMKCKLNWKGNDINSAGKHHARS